MIKLGSTQTFNFSLIKIQPDIKFIGKALGLKNENTNIYKYLSDRQHFLWVYHAGR